MVKFGNFSLLVILSLVFTFNSTSLAQDDPAYKLGNRFYRDSLYNLALEQYHKYLNNSAGGSFEADAIYKSALCYQNMNNNKNAAEKFEEYITRFPSKPDVMDAMYHAAVSRRAAGDIKEAGDWYFSVWSKYSGSVRARNSLFEAARAYENVPDIDRAVKLYETYLKRFSNTENAKKVVIYLVDIFIKKGQFQQAEKVLKVLSPKAEDKEYNLSWKYRSALLDWKLQKGEGVLLKFKELFSLLTVDFPDFEIVSTTYLDILKKSNKHAEALLVYERLDGFYENRGGKGAGYSFYKEWSENARKAQNWNALLTLSNKLLDPKYSTNVNLFEVKYRIAEAYTALKDFPRAVETLRFIETNDTTGVFAVKAVRRSAELYLSKGLYLSAISSYRNYLQFDKTRDRDVVLFKIGKIYQEKYRKFDAALREFDNLMKWYPSSSYHVRAVFSAAQCQEKLSQYKLAAANYRYVSETGSDEEIIQKAKQRYSYIADFLIKDSEGAAYKLTSLLEVGIEKLSESDRLQKLAEIYGTDLKEYEKALELYDKLEALDTTHAKKAEIKLSKAMVFEKLARKAKFSGTTKTGSYADDEAVKIYNDIVTQFPSTKEAAEAAYRLLKLKDGDIKQYEKYLELYPTGRHLPEIIVKIAGFYKKKTDPESLGKAVSLYKKIVETQAFKKLMPEAYAGLAASYLKLNELSLAKNSIVSYREGYRNTPFDAEIYFVSGLLYNREGVIDSAVSQFKEALYRYPYSYLAERLRFELAEAEFAANKLFDALNSYQVYIQDYPKGKKILKAKYGLGRCYISLGKSADAALIFTELLSSGLSSNVNNLMRYELAIIEEERGEIFKALGQYRAILENGDFNKKFDIHKRMGKLYFDSRVFNKAALSYMELVNLSTTANDSAFAMSRAAVSFIMAGERKKSDKVIKSFRDQFESRYKEYFVEIIFHEGLHLSVEKEYDKAIKRFDFILQKFDNSSWADDASYEIALAKFYQNKSDEALALFSKLPESYPTSDLIAATLFKKGMIFFGKSDYLRAATSFDEAMNHHSADKDIKYRAAGNAASAYQKASSWLKSAEAYNVMIRDFPDKIHLSSYHLKRGFSLIQAGKTSDALIEFIKAQKDPLKDDKPEIHYWIATCHSKLGDLDKAIAEYLKVPYQYASAGKWGVTSEYEAARLYERQGNFSQAMTLYNKIIRSDGEQGRFGKRAVERMRILKNIGG